MPESSSILTREHITQPLRLLSTSKSGSTHNLNSLSGSSSPPSPALVSTDPNPSLASQQLHRPTPQQNQQLELLQQQQQTQQQQQPQHQQVRLQLAQPSQPMQPVQPTQRQRARLHQQPLVSRRPSFGLHFLSSFSMRSQPQSDASSSHQTPQSAPPPQQQQQQTQPARANSTPVSPAQQPQQQQQQQQQAILASTGTSSAQLQPHPSQQLPPQQPPTRHLLGSHMQNSSLQLMSNSPTLGNLNSYVDEDINDANVTAFHDTLEEPPEAATETADDVLRPQPQPTATAVSSSSFNLVSSEPNSSSAQDTKQTSDEGKDKDGTFSVRLTPLIDHSSSSSGLYFSPIIRKIKPGAKVSIGRYTEKNKAAAHAAQGSSAPIVFKSKVVSRTHALLDCNEDGQWFLKDCKSSLGTFLNHIRLSPASQESSLMPVIDGDIIQLGMDYRGGTEEVYRCVKMRCEFNKSWQRKVNQFNLEIHKKFRNLSISDPNILANSGAGAGNNGEPGSTDNSECAICLMKVEPCQALFISPCSHAWHYKCIRPIIIKSYPQFYCPNCRTMCDLETDLEDDDDD